MICLNMCVILYVHVGAILKYDAFVCVSECVCRMWYIVCNMYIMWLMCVWYELNFIIILYVYVCNICFG